MSLWTTMLWEMSPQPKYVFNYNKYYYLNCGTISFYINYIH